MKIGPLAAGWRRLDRSEQQLLRLDFPWFWEAFEIQLFSYGVTLLVRPWVPPRG